MDVSLWRDRISSRTDLVARITHLTRGNSDEEAFDLLWEIIKEKRLKGSGKSGFIVGDKKAVCFQEVPLYSIVENLLFEETLKDRNRYSWFGLRFNKGKMYKRGARPVIYGKTEELKKILPQNEYWRIVDLDLDANNVVDWSHEREWRVCGDFQFEYDDIEVIVRDDYFYQLFVNKCIDEDRMDILKGVHGVIPLNTVIS